MNISLTNFIIINYLKKSKNFLVVFILGLLGCLSLYFIKSAGLGVTNLDYFFVMWFIMSLIYIYYICHLATYDFSNKIIQFLYSSGYSRTQYLINKMLLLLVIGFIHSLILLIIYNFIFTNFIVDITNINQIQILIIYPLMVLFLGSIDLTLAFLNQSKTKIIIANMVILIILPTSIQGILLNFGSTYLLNLYNNSPFKFISTCPSELNLNTFIVISTVLLTLLLFLFNLKLNKNKDF
ncbi:MAG: hypothetical protein ACLR2K_10510 [Paraclostridium sordellii]